MPEALKSQATVRNGTIGQGRIISEVRKTSGMSKVYSQVEYGSYWGIHGELPAAIEHCT